MSELPSFDLGGKTALVTGAARGLGRAIALALANAGADVALGLRDAAADAGLAAEIAAMGRRALPLQMDALKLDAGLRRDRQGDRRTRPDRHPRQQCRRRRRGLAGGRERGRLRPDDRPQRQVDLLHQPAGHEAHEGRRRRPHHQHEPRRPASSRCRPSRSIACRRRPSSHMTKCLAVEWGKYGINVNAVAPTFIETPGTDAGAVRSEIPRRGDRADRGASTASASRSKCRARWCSSLRRRRR